jgi:hypothetical protein
MHNKHGENKGTTLKEFYWDKEFFKGLYIGTPEQK